MKKTLEKSIFILSLIEETPPLMEGFLFKYEASLMEGMSNMSNSCSK
jgi:hypothetical protein